MSVRLPFHGAKVLKIILGFLNGETNNNRFTPFGRNDIVICFN